MKRLVYLLMLFSFVACNKPAGILEENTDTENSYLTVRIDDMNTKAYSSPNEYPSIVTFHLIVYDGDGQLEYISYFSDPLINKTIKLKTGHKTIFALANISDYTYVNLYLYNHTLSDLLETEILLDENETSKMASPIFWGRNELDLGPEGASITIEMKRYISRVILSSVKNDLPISYNTLTLKRAFLCNVVANYNLGGDAQARLWYNMEGTKEHLSPSDVIVNKLDSACPDLLYKILEEEVPRTKTHRYDEDNIATKTFYAFPNPLTTDNNGFTDPFVPTATVLMVVAEILGTEYYYPITLSNGLEANTDSIVRLTIKSLGNTADNPFAKIEKTNITAAISYIHWLDGSLIDETI